MRDVTTHTYDVAGAGVFPVDMLRYGRAWPASEADAVNIQASLTPRRGRIVYRLVGLDAPSVARWRSFGWACVPLAAGPAGA